MLSFLSGGGRMGALINAHDWEATPLGPPEGWPTALKTLVGVMLGANQPMFVAWGPEQITLYNDAYAHILGGKHPGALGRPFLDIWSEIRADLVPIVEQAYRGEPVHMDDITLLMNRHGFPEETHFSFSYTPVRGKGGVVDGFFCACAEITEQVMTQRALADSEARAHQIFDSVTDYGIIAVDLDRKVTSWNEGARRIFGWTEGDMLGQSADRIFTPQDRERGQPAIEVEGALRDGCAPDERWHIRRSGDLFWADGEMTPIRDDAGAVVGCVKVLRDRTEAREIERRLAEAEARSREELERQVAERTAERNRLWELSRDVMLRCGFDGRIIAVNPAWFEVLGWSEGELIGRSLLDLVHPDDLEQTREAAQAHAGGRSYERFDNRYRRKDGRYRWISWSTRSDAGVINAVGRDVTADRERAAELEAAQEQLRQAQKMEAVGQLTGGIAHDFNNLLTGVIGSLDLIQRKLEAGRANEIERHVSAAITSANRAAALTHRLLAFSRRQPLDPKPVNANRLVTSTEELLRRTMGEKVQLEIVTAGGLWLSLCDPHQLESAILNLAINARDAMPDGGKLTIETCNARLDNAYAARARDVRPGQYVCICVSDTGTGMDKQTIEKAFEPFFTTKPIGQGTGLGLSMIYGFARQSDGYAKIYSEPGQGTTVKLYLPRFYGEAEQEPEGVAVAAEDHATEHGEVVLVVEDEAAVRDLVIEVLSDLGYQAMEAADGASGLKLLQSAERVDLLVTDVGLPGLNGRQLADAAREVRPDLKVLFMTGYAENAAVNGGFLDPGMELLTKPFAIDALAQKLRQMLERA